MSILKKPINTEKMTQLGELADHKQYAFVVDKSASKVQIRTAIEAMYSVSVDSLRTINVRGKKRSRFSKSGFIEGKSPNYRKAVVTLASGQSIDFYKNI
jgi:large subunit ribosomal protein L23